MFLRKKIGNLGYGNNNNAIIGKAENCFPFWLKCIKPFKKLYAPALVAQLDARPTGDQEVAGSTPAEVGNILSWRLIMKYFLRSFSPFCWFKKGICQFLAKEYAQYWLTA